MPSDPQQIELRRAGLKVTMPRLKVLEVLERAEPHHLSAEDVYKELLRVDESISITTIYRVLTQFEQSGIVERHNFDDGHAVYELASETHHDHMVDVDTGSVTEFVNERIEDLQREIAAEHGYELVHHEMVLYVRKLKT
ncbi:MAG: ferric iron uptake transcriptional regulator [Gammaproteobacteria bacterium]|nr:ferric iron uptake transcriptional regulator [Gammaproteobacteria bacterium]